MENNWTPLYAIDVRSLDDDSVDVRLTNVGGDDPIAVRTFSADDALYGGPGLDAFATWIGDVVRALYSNGGAEPTDGDGTRWIDRD